MSVKLFTYVMLVGLQVSQLVLASEDSSDYGYIDRAMNVKLINVKHKAIIVRTYTDSFETQIYSPEYQLPMDISKEQADFDTPEDTLAAYMSALTFKNAREDPGWAKEVLWLLRGVRIQSSDSDYIEGGRRTLKSAGIPESYVPTIILTRRVIDVPRGYAFLEGFAKNGDRQIWRFSKKDMGWVFQVQRRPDFPPVSEALLSGSNVYVSKTKTGPEGDAPISNETSTRVPKFAVKENR